MTVHSKSIGHIHIIVAAAVKEEHANSHSLMVKACVIVNVHLVAKL